MNNLQDSDPIYKEKEAPIPENELERVLELTELDLDYSSNTLQAELEKPVVLLSMKRKENQRLIQQFLPGHYSVFVAPQKINEEPFDICIIDEFSIRSNLEILRQIKKTKAPEFLPVMLLTSANSPLDKSQQIRDFADDILSIPVSIGIFNSRVKMLLKSRRDSLESIHKIDELKQTLSKISELPRKVLHDIRAPVAGIIGVAQIIKSEAEEKNFDDILEQIELINKGGKSVMDLADEILSAHSEKEDNEANEQKENQFTLVLLQDKLEQLFKPHAKSKNVNLAINTNGDNQQLVFPKQTLLQIIGNLISNAIKFTPEFGEVTVNMELEPLINNQSESHELQVSVNDTGVGMEPEIVQSILNQDLSLDNESTAGTSGEKGHGFGIQLVKHLVQTIDGQLKITSTKGEGTSVEVLVSLNAE
ncbi:MAG: ATP-binding protein [Balneolaceae bacterium]|nr:ATP-binding protein [Balneolaceae bacterium]